MLRLLLKTRILALMDQISGGKKNKTAATAGKLALVALGALIVLGLIGALLGMLLYPLYDNLAKAGLAWLFFALTGAFACMISFMFTMFYAQGAIFEAKDNEMLLSMPIPPSAILGSRMWTLYFLNLLISATLMGTAGVIRLITGPEGVLNVVIFVVCIPLLAFISTTLSCLFGWLVSLITRRMRRKALFSLLLSLCFLGLYFYFMFGLSDHIQAITAQSGNIADAFKTVLYPFYALGTAITEANLIRLLLFAACCLVPFLLAYFILSKTFIRIVTTKVGARRLKYEARTLKESSPVWALAKKDLTHFFNSSTYMLNAGLGLVFALVLAIVTLVSGNALIDGLLKLYARMEDVGPATPYIVAVILSLLAGMAAISGPSISVEGKNFWILESLPVETSQILRGKLLFHLVLALPVSLVSSVLFIPALKMDVQQTAIVIGMPLLAHIFCALSGLIVNVYTAKLDYPSEAKAIKSTSASLYPLLGTAALSLAPSVIYFVFLNEKGVPFSTPMFIAVAVFAALDIAMYIFLLSPAVEKRFHKIGR